MLDWSEPRKSDRFWVEFSAYVPRLGGAEDDEAITVFGRPEGVHSETGYRDAGRGDLPQGRNQPGDVFQLEAQVRRVASDGDAVSEAAGG